MDLTYYAKGMLVQEQIAGAQAEAEQAHAAQRVHARWQPLPLLRRYVVLAWTC